VLATPAICIVADAIYRDEIERDPGASMPVGRNEWCDITGYRGGQRLPQVFNTKERISRLELKQWLGPPA